MKAATALRRCLIVPAAARAQVDENRTLSHHGVERRYVLHQPPAAAAPGPMSLVVALHGLTQPVEGLREWLHFDPVADRERFAIAGCRISGREGAWTASA